MCLDISKTRVLNYKWMAYLYQMFPANRLRELRKKAKLTQIQLAELSGVSQSAISQLENDTIGLNVPWMRSFARIFSERIGTTITPADILGQADHPNRLSAEEEALLAQFREADQQQREMIQRVAAPIREFRPAPPETERDAA